MLVPRSQATFGSLLREHRLSAGLTQDALSERSGVSLRTIQEVEADHARPRRSTVVSLAEALTLPDAARDELLRMAAPRPRRRHAEPSGDAADGRHSPDVVLAPAPSAETIGDEAVLVALPRSTPTNVPWPVSSLLGRETELAVIRDLIGTDRQRLVTLTGVGGSGKTRLAIEVATELLDQFVDGVWFVDLTPTSSPALVPRSVAGALGVREVQAAPILDALLGFLRRKRLLLVLDNCEHLIDACAKLADRLLTACPDLHVLATSREPLRIDGERRWPVQPLAVPDLNGQPTFDALAGTAAVRLFVERARAIDPGFALTEANAASVAQVCARLDGIPLAIELAASRLGVLEVEQVAARLDDAFRLLAGGARGGPTRQQTMEAALTWSYDLLTPAEQATFRVLSVFAGGFTLEAADARAERPERRLLGRGEQVVAPGERRLHRLLPGRPAPRAAGQQPEGVSEPGGDLVDLEHAQPRGRELDRQRDAVQPGADLRHRRRVRRGQRELRVDRPGALDEEAHGRRAGQHVEPRPAGEVGDGQRLDRPPSFAGDPERLAARRQDVEVRAGRQQGFGEPGTGLDQVLAVVQHQQQALPPQVAEQRIRDRHVLDLAHAQRPGDAPRHEGRARRRRQVDEPDAVRETLP